MISSQEKIAAAFSYIFFWIPVWMHGKTEFTIFHMKQWFIFNIIFIWAQLVGNVWIVGWLIKMILLLIWFIFGGWSAYQAYLGSRFSPPYFEKYINTFISKIRLTSLFMK